MGNAEKTDKVEKRFYNMQEFQTLFGFSKPTAIALAKTEGFPAIKIGRELFIDKHGLEKWIAANYNKTVEIPTRKKGKNDEL